LARKNIIEKMKKSEKSEKMEKCEKSEKMKKTYSIIIQQTDDKH
jgi:hypothetical protein